MTLLSIYIDNIYLDIISIVNIGQYCQYILSIHNVNIYLDIISIVNIGQYCQYILSIYIVNIYLDIISISNKKCQYCQYILSRSIDDIVNLYHIILSILTYIIADLTHFNIVNIVSIYCQYLFIDDIVNLYHIKLLSKNGYPRVMWKSSSYFGQ